MAHDPARLPFSARTPARQAPGTRAVRATAEPELFPPLDGDRGPARPLSAADCVRIVRAVVERLE